MRIDPFMRDDMQVSRLRRAPIRKVSTLLLFTALLPVMAATPAHAFELFGIKLWGKDKAEEADDVIAEPKRYKVEVTSSGNRTNKDGKAADVDDLIKGASRLVADEEKAASGSGGLLAKARGDYRRLLMALYGEGRYGGTISIKVDGQEVADLPADTQLPDTSNIVINVDPGPQFLFARASITELAPPVEERRNKLQTPKEAGFKSGELAKSGVILKAERLAVEAWRRQGYAKAKIANENVVADHAGNVVDADITVEPGQLAHYGPLTVQGTARMDPEFVAYMADLKPGERYDPADLERTRRRLARMDVFRSTTIQEAQEINRDGSLPLDLIVQERKPRRFGVGANYSTLDGAGVEAFWMHRNLFGKAERLRFDAKVSGIGGSQDSSFDPKNFTYQLGTTFTKPGVFTPDTDFVSSLAGKREVLDNYTETSVNGQAGFTHIFDEYMSGRLFANVSHARFDDDFYGKRDFFTVGMLGGILLDKRNSQTNATSGYYADGVIEPFYEIKNGSFSTKFTAEGRGYYGFGADNRVVLAGRLKVGSIVGADMKDLPPDKVFFAGGGGSVRGYAYRSIGVKKPGDVVIGGRSLVEMSGEVRTKVTDSIGVVGFVDGGYVGEETYPDFAENLRLGAGAGLRYDTSLGPIRFDVAVPLNRSKGDSSFAFYVGIGQAF
ncbi:autotransporter secretion outer membrane protein TamA [Pseudochrobactrum asaccharolyticum]|uniref:Autotransporter secretion outer membrane protein TamA n=2 Tax=Pseudochrobactrum asaccharolyticum TaxID=354351 RepID=A0A366E8C1_9HYPH|nr:autotransporter secretion outer membrane protein TamA [Pseudochrobactrum asaccharolyticum]